MEKRGFIWIILLVLVISVPAVDAFSFSDTWDWIKDLFTFEVKGEKTVTDKIPTSSDGILCTNATCMKNSSNPNYYCLEDKCVYCLVNNICDIAKENTRTCPQDCECSTYLDCPGGQQCLVGKCVASSTCGNTSCDQEENCGNCAADCACTTGYTCRNNQCILIQNWCETGTVNVTRAVGCYQSYQNEMNCPTDWAQPGQDCGTNDYSLFSSVETDSACCADNKYCVYGGKCHPNLNFTKINGEEVMCFAGKWIERDSTSKTCTGTSACSNSGSNSAWASNYKWISAGTSGIGEYDNATATECCGDDSGEYIIISGTLSLCCNSSNSTIQNGSCINAPLLGCGNNSCDQGEDCSNCAADCACATGYSCKNNNCIKKCNNDSDCPSGKECSGSYCVGADLCGDNICELGECGSCPSDCSATSCCATNISEGCDSFSGETCSNCPDDCGQCPYQEHDQEQYQQQDDSGLNYQAPSDLSYLNDEKQQNEPNEETPGSKTGLWIALVFVALIILGVIIFAIVRHKMRYKTTMHNKPFTQASLQQRVGESKPNEPSLQKEPIKLLPAPQKYINPDFNKGDKIEIFVKKALHAGYNNAEIKKALLDKGWKESQIMRYF